MLPKEQVHVYIEACEMSVALYPFTQGEVVDVETISNRRVLLIDDVFTTGATVNECARVCMCAGAQSVHVWTLARGLGVMGT